MTSIVNTVDVGYFSTAGVAVVRGREFTTQDQETSALVAIVNQKMAQDYWPDGDALGRRIRLPGETAMRQVVGIARTANYSAWAEAPQSCVYVPLEQAHPDAMTLYVRTKGNPEQAVHSGPARASRRGATRPGQRHSHRAGGRRWRSVSGADGCRSSERVRAAGSEGWPASASTGSWRIRCTSESGRLDCGWHWARRMRTVLRLILKQGMTLVLARRADWFRGGTDRRPRGELDAVRRERQRPAQRVGSGSSPADGCVPCLLLPGAPGQPGRPAGGIATGIAAPQHEPQHCGTAALFLR